jgi:hypothetical protein
MTVLIRQEHDLGCAVASLAMVTGQTYEQVRAWILDHWTPAVMGQDPAGFLTKSGVTHYCIDWYLGENGYAWRRKYNAHALGEWPPPPFAPVHIAQVVQPSGATHFVVLTASGEVLDPMSDLPRTLSDWERVNQVMGVWDVRTIRDASEGDQ